MDGLNKQIIAARRDLERAERDYARLQHRREEIMARPARDEARLEGLMSAEG